MKLDAMGELEMTRGEPVAEDRKEAHTERIVDGVWTPGGLAEFSGVSFGATTKGLERRLPGIGHTPRLRVTADAKRAIDDRADLELALQHSNSPFTVDEFRGRKVSAGLQLTRALKQLDPEADPHDMVKTRLVHGTDVVVIDEDYVRRSKEELVNVIADGLVTNLKHRPLLVAAADCAPIMVYDPAGQAIGIFHAGRRGTEAGLATRGVQTMMREYGSRLENLRVVVGPSIDKESYSVDREFYDRMSIKVDQNGTPYYTLEELDEIFAPDPMDATAVQFDNGKAIAIEMKKLGIPAKNIEVSQYSTYRDNEHFSSDRKEGFANRDTIMAMAVLK